MSFLGKIFKKKKSAPSIKKAVAVSLATKTPITVSKVPESSSVKRSLFSPFVSTIKADLAPLQLPNTDFSVKLTRAPYVPKKTVSPVKNIKQTVVKTPELEVIKPFVSQIKTSVSPIKQLIDPVEKVNLPFHTSAMNVVNESILTNQKTMMQKIQDFIKLHGVKLLIPVAIIIGVFVYMKNRKSTPKRK